MSLGPVPITQPVTKRPRMSTGAGAERFGGTMRPSPRGTAPSAPGSGKINQTLSFPKTVSKAGTSVSQSGGGKSESYGQGQSISHQTGTAIPGMGGAKKTRKKTQPTMTDLIQANLKLTEMLMVMLQQGGGGMMAPSPMPMAMPPQGVPQPQMPGMMPR